MDELWGVVGQDQPSHKWPSYLLFDVEGFVLSRLKTLLSGAALLRNYASAGEYLSSVDSNLRVAMHCGPHWQRSVNSKRVQKELLLAQRHIGLSTEDDRGKDKCLWLLQHLATEGADPVYHFPRIFRNPASQAISSKVNRQISIARNPRRISSNSIAISRCPRDVSHSQF